MRLKMLNLSNVFTLLLIASTTTAQSTEIGRSQLTCKETKDCMCLDFSEIEIQCPKFEPRVILRLVPNNNVHFECDNTTEMDFNLLPSYELETASMLQVTKCKLVNGSIMDTYLKNIKIDKIRALQFVSSGANRNNEFKAEHFKGLGNIGRFDLRGAEGELERLPEDFFNEMKSLTWVRIRVAKIHLPDNLFAPLENLEFLELGHNKLESLPSGFLRNQHKLSHLNLWGNSLKNLSKDSFDGLFLVKDLDLSSNGIVSLESDVFSPLVNLSDINLSGNDFESLPEGLFANNKKIMKIRLMENRRSLKMLPSGLFANLPELIEVFLKAEVEVLPGNLFYGSANIEGLKLDQNKLNNLPATLLRDQKQLTRLHLQDNLIDSIPENFFVGTPRLSELNLSRNRLTIIQKRVFKPLSELKKLVLSNNQIMTIEETAFINNRMLEYLDLQNNLIVLKLSSPFQNMENLKNLNLANNSIKEVFEDFTLRSLETLDLSHNKLEMLKLTDLNNLKANFIDFSYNQIQEIEYEDIPDILFDAEIKVKLDHNPIICDCKIFKFFKYSQENQNLKIDDLKCAQPENLANIKVKDLNPFELVCPLDNNGTSKKNCPSGCKCSVRSVDRRILMECSSEIKFNQLPNVQYYEESDLTIVNGNLSELPRIQDKENFSEGYKKITNLTLEGISLAEISIDNLPPALKYLNLRSNQLENLNESLRMFFESENFTELNLGNNPWRCDCNTRGFVRFVQEMTRAGKIKDQNEIFCGENLVIETDFARLCSEDESMFIVILCVLTAIAGVVFGGLAAFYYKYQKQIKMWLYSHSLLLWFVTEEELDKEKRYDAFVSYSHCDNDFVADYLLPELENGTIPYKLCVHERDWVPGLEISTQISNSVNDSRRIIIVMSPNYLQSAWAKWEFQVAQSHAATEKRSRIIVILKEDIGDINKLEPDIRDYLKLNTYVEWGDKWFWEKLKYAMPHVKSSERLDKGKGLVKTAMKSSVDDKLELIKPISLTPPMLTTPPAEKIANPLITSLNAKNAANAANNNGKAHNGYNGHINSAFVINTSSRQSDV